MSPHLPPAPPHPDICRQNLKQPPRLLQCQDRSLQSLLTRYAYKQQKLGRKLAHHCIYHLSCHVCDGSGALKLEGYFCSLNKEQQFDSIGDYKRQAPTRGSSSTFSPPMPSSASAASLRPRPILPRPLAAAAAGSPWAAAGPLPTARPPATLLPEPLRLASMPGCAGFCPPDGRLGRPGRAL